MTRVSVFIDYENTRVTAREIFGNPRHDPHTFGNVDPLKLGRMLEQIGEEPGSPRQLTMVRVYRGRLGAKSGSRVQGASARQFAAWESQALVKVRSRPVRYQPTAWSRGKPTKWRAQEKGIDVMMALDIALGARDDAYDVGVVMSADSDLVPAIEVALDAGKRVETAMWWSPEHPHLRMKAPGRRLWNHALDTHRFAEVRDDIDYRSAP